MEIQHIEVNGANQITSQGRLTYVASLLFRRDDEMVVNGVDEYQGDEFTVGLHDWPELLADEELHDHLYLLAVYGGQCRVRARIHGVSLDEAVRLADQAGLPTVAAAIVAGTPFQMAAAGEPAR